MLSEIILLYLLISHVVFCFLLFVYAKTYILQYITCSLRSIPLCHTLIQQIIYNYIFSTYSYTKYAYILE